MRDVDPEIAAVMGLHHNDQQIFIVGLLGELSKQLADVRGIVEGQTIMLGKICRQVGVSREELLRAAEDVRDA